MTIAIDIRPAQERIQGGVATFARRVAEGLLARHSHDYVLVGNAFAGPEPFFRGGKLAFRRFPNKALNLAIAATGFPRFEQLAGGADASFFPNLNFIATKKPYVMTVHDLSFVRFPEFFTAKQRLWHVAVRPKKSFQRATSIVAVSRHTKDDLCETYGVDPEKVIVAYPGVEPRFFEQVGEGHLAAAKKKYALPDRYILSLCTIEPRKNIGAIIRSFAAMPDGIGLVIAGAKGWKYETILREATLSPRRADIRFLDFIAEEDKPALYQAAATFAYPSHYEGFGLPVLEAMASGVPVVASATSSLGEIVGNAGMLVNPLRDDELTDSLRAVIEENSLREKFIRLASEKAKMFTWEKTAGQVELAFKNFH